MNDQTPTTTPPPPAPPPPSGDWREMRAAERRARHEARMQRHGGRRNGFIWGVILVAAGGVMLLEQMGIARVTNWWALFILIPAFWAFVGSWETYRDNGRLTRRAATSFVVGILLTMLTLVLMVNVEFGYLWPVLLIGAGAALLVAGLIPE